MTARLLITMVLGLMNMGDSTMVPWPDCNGTGETDVGSFGPLAFHNITWEGKIFYVLVPQGGKGPWPVVTFMHGWTGAYEQFAFAPGHEPNASTWYARPMEIYATHGFVVVFPFWVNPTADLNHSVTETNGSTILKSIDFIKFSQTDESSPLKGLLDVKNVAVAGHSMGSGEVIRVGQNLSSGAVKFLAVQHPFEIVMQGLAEANKFPMLITTSTNDEAFFPAPKTAAGVIEAFNNANLTGPAAALQFSAAACPETNKSMPWTESGHDCSFKPNVETPWVLRGLKLYAQLDGAASSRCAAMMWGSGPGGASKDPNMDKAVILPGRQVFVV